MTFFHGSTVAGITELRPTASWYSNLKEPTVYLTTSRQLALHYIWDMERIGVKCPMLDIRPDGTLVFEEMFSGALGYFYKGVSGYIYRCEGDYPINPDSKVFTCATSSKPVPVVDYEYIDDVYEHICAYEKKGTFIYKKYEDAPQWRKDVIRGHVMRFIKRNGLMENPQHSACCFVQEKFPQYWAEAQVLWENHLL